MYCYEYQRPMLTVDAIILNKVNQEFEILLIKRKNNPFEGHWALPGGFIEMNETLDEAVKRELEEETGLTNLNLIQFRTYGELNRDPRGRTISVVYYALLNNNIQIVKAGDDAAEAEWYPLKNLPELAFDHKKIIDELNIFLQLV